MESLTSPRSRSDDKTDGKVELDFFFSLSVEEQKDFLRKLFIYRESMEYRFPDIKAPHLSPSSSSSSKNLYIHLVEFKHSNQKPLSDISSGIYVKLSMGKKTRKTKTQKEISSVFNETFVFKRAKKKSTLLIEIYSALNQLMGEVKIFINTLEETDVIQRWYPVTEKKLPSGPPGALMGSISIRYCYTEEKIDDMKFLEETFKVFGSSLEEIELRERQPIPSFLVKMTDYIRENGLKEEGLFRVSGGKNAVQELKERINTGNTLSVNFNNYPIAVISTLYKNFFDSLPEPLLPYSLSHFFLECKNNIDDLTTLINKLPRRNRIVLAYLIKFLREVAENEENNKMSVKNLCITFGPILFRLTETSVEETINLSQKGRSCLETMIIHYPTLFVINAPLFSSSSSSTSTSKEYIPHRKGSAFVTLSSTTPNPLLMPGERDYINNNNHHYNSHHFNNNIGVKEVTSLSASLRTSKSKSNNLAFPTILKSPRGLTSTHYSPPKLSRSLSDPDFSPSFPPVVIQLPTEYYKVDKDYNRDLRDSSPPSIISHSSNPPPSATATNLAIFFKDLKDKDKDKDNKDKEKEKEKEEELKPQAHKRRKSIDFAYHNLITRKVKDIKL